MWLAKDRRHLWKAPETHLAHSDVEEAFSVFPSSRFSAATLLVTVVFPLLLALTNVSVKEGLMLSKVTTCFINKPSCFRGKPEGPALLAETFHSSIWWIVFWFGWNNVARDMYIQHKFKIKTQLSGLGDQGDEVSLACLQNEEGKCLLFLAV